MDKINKPSHYASSDIEAIETIKASMSEEQFKGYLKGTIQKYLWRLDSKDTPLENSLKASWFMNKLIHTLKEEK